MIAIEIKVPSSDELRTRSYIKEQKKEPQVAETDVLFFISFPRGDKQQENSNPMIKDVRKQMYVYRRLTIRLVSR